MSDNIVLKALLKHKPDFHQPDFWMCCGCGENWPVDGSYVRNLAKTFAKHQAKAVKKALKKAKEVEDEVCPFDCDSCHGDGCPCDRMGCDGEEDDDEDS